MAAEENLGLWQATLGTLESHTPLVIQLQASYRSARRKAVTLASRIAADLPDFTVHDERHLEALWQIANQLEDGSGLNPLEGYVFGMALLIHDLGMAVAAYPGGAEELQSEPLWADLVALAGVDDTPEDSDERLAAERHATAEMLRLLHAEQAEKLGSVSWSGPSGPEFLIEDSELRNTLGNTIGRVAASHGRSLEALAREFLEDVGVPASFPPEWQIDALRLGALLRVADAANVDGTRAPSFDRAIQRPATESTPHWDFQAQIARPYVSDGSLVYTSTQPFGKEKADAWWLAFEMLQMVHRECSSVDRLLHDRGKTSFAASSVRGASSAQELSRLVRVDGWTPVDASVYVGDVASLVASLGGEHLYGAQPWIALRELLQNASDAVLARRELGELGEKGGRITVALDETDAGRTLVVEDDGVGMSERVILHGLLNFGHSFWGSPLMVEELPGLAASGFRSIGRFGIGFFAAFMLGDHVSVTTRSIHAGPHDTVTLEFGHGVAGRPLLRDGTAQERLNGPGTRVTIRLKEFTSWFAPGAADDPRTVPLSDLCLTVFPAPEVEVAVREDGRQRRIAVAGDWRTISGVELLNRVAGRSVGVALTDAEELETAEDIPFSERRAAHIYRALSRHVRPLLDGQGTVVGRGVILPSAYILEESGLGVMCVGGLRAKGAEIAGLFQGEPMRAARDEAVAIAPDVELARWSTEQAGLLARSGMPARTLFACGSRVRALGGDTAKLPVCFTSAGWLDVEDLDNRGYPDEIVLVFEACLHDEFDDRGPVELLDHVFATELMADQGGLVLRGVSVRAESDPIWGDAIGVMDRGALATLVANAACRFWDCAVEEAFDEERQPDPDDPAVVGTTSDGREFRVIETVVLRRPRHRERPAHLHRPRRAAGRSSRHER